MKRTLRVCMGTSGGVSRSCVFCIRTLVHIMSTTDGIIVYNALLQKSENIR